MTPVLSSRALGWLSLLLLGIVIALPYLRGNPRAIQFARQPMRLHYWFAPLLAIGSLVHAWIPMASRHMPKTNFDGLWIATVALGMILLQIVLGVALRYIRAGAWLRQTHWVVMLGITALVLIHLWMNNQVLRNVS